MLEAALAAYDGPAVPLIELGATAPLRSAALAGSGPAVLSVLAVAEDVAAGRLVEVPLAEEIALRRTLRAVWPRGRELGEAAGWLVRVARGGLGTSRRRGISGRRSSGPRYIESEWGAPKARA